MFLGDERGINEIYVGVFGAPGYGLVRAVMPYPLRGRCVWRTLVVNTQAHMWIQRHSCGFAIWVLGNRNPKLIRTLEGIVEAAGFKAKPAIGLRTRISSWTLWGRGLQPCEGSSVGGGHIWLNNHICYGLWVSNS